MISNYEFDGATFEIRPAICRGGYNILAKLPVYRGVYKDDWTEDTDNEIIEKFCRDILRQNIEQWKANHK